MYFSPILTPATRLGTCSLHEIEHNITGDKAIVVKITDKMMSVKFTCPIISPGGTH